MKPISAVNDLLKKHGLNDFKWIPSNNIVVANWVRMKCQFGCPDYGKGGCCPPNTPPVAQCREFFSEYGSAVLLHFTIELDKPGDRQEAFRSLNDRLVKAERDVFLAGFYKAFLLFVSDCKICPDCTGDRINCRDKIRARPSPESMAVDVYSTVRNSGYPIRVLKSYEETMDRYAILLVE